ncbi:hypothetical protein [Thioalkalivibrio sp. ALE20]|uniref:hypothetical protein n=1 Tax=Thioalkalivibrio sp. ALE20 TaxID=545275 RepID=UPI00035FC6A6
MAHGLGHRPGTELRGVRPAEHHQPRRPPGAATVVWEESVEVARGEAWRGPWRMNDSDFRYVDDASVAINDHGEVVL